MAQTDTRKCTFNSIMRKPAFQQGMTDYHKGAPIPYGIPVDAEWDYERGRLYAAATGQKFVHQKGGEVKIEQQKMLARLFKEKAIL